MYGEVWQSIVAPKRGGFNPFFFFFLNGIGFLQFTIHLNEPKNVEQKLYV